MNQKLTEQTGWTTHPNCEPPAEKHPETLTEAIAASGYTPRNDGVECETWTGLATVLGYLKRKRITIWRHPGVWPVEDCSRRPGTCCGVIQGPHCSVQHRKGLELAPAVWRVMSPFTAGPWCDADLPPEYRALVDGPPVLQRYIHPHDEPRGTWTGDG